MWAWLARRRRHCWLGERLRPYWDHAARRKHVYAVSRVSKCVVNQGHYRKYRLTIDRFSMEKRCFRFL